jgi:3-hydroxyisobutyrate dehydrogenase
LIAYFGTGLLGSGFTRKLLERGETVHVWNRTAEKAKALEADGAKAFANPADAVKGAAQLHLTLSDDAAVDGVLEPLASALDKDTVIVDHTTTAPTPTAERVKRWTERGFTFVHAPVFMGPQNARDATGLMLLSGPPDVRARVKPLLEPMTGKVVELGDDPAHASAFKLFGNMLLITVVGGIADLYQFSRALGIEPKEAFSLFDHFNPGNAIPVRGKSMAEGKFSPASFEATMARKDLRLMVEEAGRHGKQLDVVPGVAALLDRYIAAGHGSEDFSVIGSGKA